MFNNTPTTEFLFPLEEGFHLWKTYLIPENSLNVSTQLVTHRHFCAKQELYHHCHKALC